MKLHGGGIPPTGDECVQEVTCDPCIRDLCARDLFCLAGVFLRGPGGGGQFAAEETAWFAATYPNTAEAAILAPAPGYLRPITDAVQLPVA